MKESQEKKIAYSITKYVDRDEYRMKGIGKLSDNDIILKDKTRLEDVVKRCQPIYGKPNEYKGFYDMFEEVDVVTDNGSFERVEVNTEYKVWYKII